MNYNEMNYNHGIDKSLILFKRDIFIFFIFYIYYKLRVRNRGRIGHLNYVLFKEMLYEY